MHFRQLSADRRLGRRLPADQSFAAVGEDRLGSKADLTDPKFDFRFTPDNRHAATSTACPKSARNGLMHRSKWDAEASITGIN
jgi:hypothetical protein